MKTPGQSITTRLARPDQPAMDSNDGLFPSLVLHERERWAAQTREALATGSQAVVRLSARMPAVLRTRGQADIPIGCGADAFETGCHRQGLNLILLGHGQGVLGPWRIWSSEGDPFILKQLALLIEDGSRQGQLLDLDVYSQDGPVSRSLLGLPPRTCVVCGQPAAVCAGRAIHATSIVEAAFLDLLAYDAMTLSNTVPRPSRIRTQGSLQSSSGLHQDLRTDTPLAHNRP